VRTNALKNRDLNIGGEVLRISDRVGAISAD
jgi:hypothetical protein